MKVKFTRTRISTGSNNVKLFQRKRSGVSVQRLGKEWLETYEAIQKFLNDSYAYVHTCGDIVSNDELDEMPSAPIFRKLDTSVFINPEIKEKLKQFVMEIDKFTDFAINIVEKDQEAEMSLKLALEGENEVLSY